MVPVAVVAAVILVAGLLGGGWFVFLRDDNPSTTADDGPDDGPAGKQSSGQQSDDTDTTPSTVGEFDWVAPYEELPSTGLLGSWFTDDLAVRGGYSTLIGYDAESGSEEWRIDLGDERRFCGMSEQIVDGIGLVAVAFADGMSEVTQAPNWVCSGVVAIDVAAGEQVADQDLVPEELIPSEGVQPEVVGEHWVMRQRATLQIFPADGNGEPVVVDAESLGADPLNCLIADFLPNGATAEVLVECREDKIQVFTIDPASAANGEVTPTAQSSAPLPNADTTYSPYLAAADPHVVVLGVFGQPGGAVLVLDGENVTTIPQEDDWGHLDLGPLDTLGSDEYLQRPRERYAIAVAEDTIYLRTEPGEEGELYRSHQIVAFGYDGEHRWNQALGESLGAELVASVDTGVLAISHGNTESRPQLFHLASTDGARTEVGPPWEGDDDTNLVVAPPNAEMHWDGSTLTLMPQQNPMMPDSTDFVYRLS